MVGQIAESDCVCLLGWCVSGFHGWLPSGSMGQPVYPHAVRLILLAAGGPHVLLSNKCSWGLCSKTANYVISPVSQRQHQK